MILTWFESANTRINSWEDWAPGHGLSMTTRSDPFLLWLWHRHYVLVINKLKSLHRNIRIKIFKHFHPYGAMYYREEIASYVLVKWPTDLVFELVNLHFYLNCPEWTIRRKSSRLLQASPIWINNTDTICQLIYDIIHRLYFTEKMIIENISDHFLAAGRKCNLIETKSHFAFKQSKVWSKIKFHRLISQFFTKRYGCYTHYSILRSHGNQMHEK